MSTNINYQAVAPELLRPMYETSKLIAESGLDPKLLTLVELRASQLNRCAFCLALHMREGKALGDTDDRLFGVPGWREASWYSARERAALEWTEALTTLAQQHPSDDLLARMKELFDDRELVYLTHTIAMINTWNRLNVAFGTPPERAEELFKMLHGAAAATAAGSGTN
jgi:AhpD family alkylhydroperoxidase